MDSRKLWLLMMALMLAGQLQKSQDREVFWLAAPVFAIASGVAFYTIAPNLLGFLKHNRVIYQLRRTHNALVDKLARPFGRPGPLEKLYVHIRPPKWVRRSEPELMLIYRDQKKLMEDGAIVLATIVQANGLLFKHGYKDAPANVVYTADYEVENPALRLHQVAHRIFNLKGTSPEDPDEKKLARMVSYEYGRDFRVTVPEKLAGDFDVTYTTIMVHRKHLPQGYLANEFFPLLIHEESRAGMILPARYWSKDLLADWGVNDRHTRA